MIPSGGLPRAVGWALVLHGVAMALLRLLSMGGDAREVLVRDAPAVAADLDVEVVVVAPRARAEPPEAEEPVAEARSPARLEARPVVGSSERSRPLVREPPLAEGAPPAESAEPWEARGPGESEVERGPEGGPGAEEAADPLAPWSLSLTDRIGLAPAPGAAPTRPPAREPLTSRSVELGLREGVRVRDELNGLGKEEATAVTSVAKAAFRQVSVPSGTRARLEVELDRAGRVLGARIVSASAGEASIWSAALAAIRAALTSKPVPMSVDGRVAGAKVTVDAEIVHALPSGSLDGESVGDCIPPPDVGAHGSGDMFPSEGFFGVGGSLFGDRPHGTCTTRENPDAKRHLEVRTRTATVFAGAPPRPGAAMPKPAKLLPWIEKGK